MVLYCFSTNCQYVFLMSRAWSDAKITWQRLVTRDASVTPCHENCHNFDTTLTQAMVTCHRWRIERQIASDSFVNLCIGCIDVIIVLFIWDLTKDAEMHPKTCNLSSRWTKKHQLTEQTMSWGQKVARAQMVQSCSNAAAWLSHWAKHCQSDREFNADCLSLHSSVRWLMARNDKGPPTLINSINLLTTCDPINPFGISTTRNSSKPLQPQ